MMQQLLMSTSALLSITIFMLKLKLTVNVLTPIPISDHQIYLVKKQPSVQTVQPHLTVIVPLIKTLSQPRTQECFLIYLNLINENLTIHLNYS